MRIKRPRLLLAVTDPQSAIFFKGQLEWLRLGGFEIHFLCSPGLSVKNIVVQQGAEFHEVAMRRGISPFHDFVSLLKIIRVIMTVRPAIVSAGTPKAGMLAMIASCLCATPIRIYVIRGLRFETATGFMKTTLMFLEGLVCKVATRVVCVGHGIRGIALRNGICRRNRSTVIAHGSSNGVDCNAYDPTKWITSGQEFRDRHHIPRQALVVGFVGRVVRDKGIFELVQAWGVIKASHPSAHLLIVGDFEPGDPIDDVTKARIREEASVHMIGFVEDVRAAYAAMQVLALPTYREGLPGVLLEAGAMQIPAVASNIPGCSDVIKDGATGRLVAVGESTALAEAIGHYLSDPDCRSQHGIAARRHVTDKFSRIRVWEATLRFYRELLSRRTEGNAIPESGKGGRNERA